MLFTHTTKYDPAVAHILLMPHPSHGGKKIVGNSQTKKYIRTDCTDSERQLLVFVCIVCRMYCQLLTSRNCYAGEYL